MNADWQKWSLNWPNMRKSSDVSFVGILRHDKEEQSERVFASLWFSSSPLFFFSVVSSRAFITSRKVFSFRKWRGMVSIEQNYGNNTDQSQKKAQIIKWTNQSSKQILERFPSAGKFDFTSDWLQKWQRVKCNPLHTQKIIKHINFGSYVGLFGSI